MPMPQEYQLASHVYEKILARAQDELGLSTRNQTYTTIQAVLTVFRRRLPPEQILQFADVLPPLIRAIFVADWDEIEFTGHFGSRESLALEVRSLRRNHNFSPSNAIEGVVTAIRANVEESRLDELLDSFPQEAKFYWAAQLHD